MTKVLMSGVAALALLAAVGTAQAVDVTNLDEIAHQVRVNNVATQEETLVDIGPGETISQVCQSCELSLGEDEPMPFEAEQVALIKDGKLAIQQ
ncbi:MAG: hypothetical protein VW405_06065 [Rhodospirillaceae bacterium]